MCSSSIAGLPIALHTSGSLMEWLVARHPEYLDRLAALVAAGRIEIVGGAFYEPILTMIPPRDRVGQITRYAEWLVRSVRHARQRHVDARARVGAIAHAATWSTPACATRCWTTSISRTPASTKISSTATTSPRTTRKLLADPARQRAAAIH